MRLVFIGSSKFGLRCLQLLSELKCCTVTGVVTAPSEFTISYRPEGVTNVLHADVSSFCIHQDIPLETIISGMNDPGLPEKVRQWKPQAFIVAGWYHMIPKSWRDMAPAFGLHASLLPDYSGGAPLVWAMINGETKTGITLFQLDDGVDSGPIAGQVEEPIYPHDTISSLYKRIEERGLELLSRHLPEMTTGSLELNPQDESNRRVFPQRVPDDGKIDWNLDAGFIERFIRAQTRPYPGAFTILDGERLSIWAARNTIEVEGWETGMIRKDGEGFFVSAGEHNLKLEEISFCGRNYTSENMNEILNDGGQQLGSQ
ncbi:MAG: hypothetical protein CL886_10405 [Dehalococcoidia bacterium]|nr:hypothetical protein [Dehalococcoidia bacterium]MQG38337.1 methionyl-tRNA formyltransferase [SAR202 cluster bacterium]|tara:strand:- start:3465 stop:4409 length:945 start_codon:yes stop_codon:yes gene_type:complete